MQTVPALLPVAVRNICGVVCQSRLNLTSLGFRMWWYQRPSYVEVILVPTRYQKILESKSGHLTGSDFRLEELRELTSINGKGHSDERTASISVMQKH